MELLEREGALAALAEVRNEAGRGAGRVVFVTGEPGIGKTSLVTRFVRDLGPEARVLFGTCDDLSIPRPLGALRDLAGTVSPPLEQALAAGVASHELQSLLIAELELPPRPTVLVVEDVHWADDATLDSITVLGRRIGSLPAIVVLTFRSGEAAPPLRAAVGAIRAEDSVYVELAPLSAGAVASLAGEGADDVYAATGGNPFYVTELLASERTTDLPPSITNAVLGRVSRLDVHARRLMELVSVVPSRARTSVLDAVMPEWPEAAEEPERQGLLEVEPRYVRFRHELARNAIRSSIPAAARRRLHGEILDALLALDADPADVVHHAEAAGAADVVAEYALVAARRATALESNREAYSHYRRAADFVDRLDPDEQALVLEELANATYAVGRLEEAFEAMERAIAAYAVLGDREAVGRCTRLLSRFYWYSGDGDEARNKASEAVRILEPLGESVELAHAYSGLSQLAMLADDTDDALVWGGHALELAIRLGDERVRIHALVNIGSAQIQLDDRDSATLLEAIQIADAARGAARGGARAVEPGVLHAGLGAPRRGAPLRRAGPHLRPRARGAHARAVPRVDHRLAEAARRRLGRGRADRAPRAGARGDGASAARAHRARRPGDPPRRPGRGRAAGRRRRARRSHRRAAADRAGARAGERMGADERRADAGRAHPARARGARGRAGGSRSGSAPGPASPASTSRSTRRRARRRTRRCCAATGGRRPTRSARQAGRTTARSCCRCSTTRSRSWRRSRSRAGWGRSR